MFTKTTHHIKVTAIPTFLRDHSDPGEEHYVWAYTIQVENHGDLPVQLLDRHWVITDAIGQTQEVRGPGVVGETPTIKPGQAFQYTSGTSLPTPSGIMLGSYGMVNARGERFEIDIPAFSLDSPYFTPTLN
jgi:ApaG protein